VEEELPYQEGEEEVGEILILVEVVEEILILEAEGGNFILKVELAPLGAKELQHFTVEEHYYSMVQKN